MSKENLTYKDIDRSMLKALPNPGNDAYEIKISAPEFTFLGKYQQPDFARIYMTIYPKNHIIELKSLKHYFQSFRDIIVSYERLINIVYDDLVDVYSPERLRVVMEFYPRGGIASRLCIDSDWEIRGGEEKYWKHTQEDWSFKHESHTI